MNKIMPIEAICQLVGQPVRPSEWFRITQERIDQFADATNDHQFIHVDPDRAAATPFGGTIAHGYLTLSLLPHLLMEQAPVPENLEMSLNYGLDKVRFLHPVGSGRRIRALQQIEEVTEKTPGFWIIKTAVTVEIEGEEKPALIARQLSMFQIN